MRFVKCVILGAIFLTGSVVQAPVAKAAPFPAVVHSDGSGVNSLAEGLLRKVSGCHRYRRYHLTYLWRYPVWHKHRRDCAPIPARPPINRGIIYRDGFGYYCHPQWRKHRHPRWGKLWHRHAGRNCVVSRGWEWRGGPRAGCRKVGRTWICG